MSLCGIDAIITVLILKVKPRDGVPAEQLQIIADKASDVHNKLVQSVFLLEQHVITCHCC